jgi:hypothetical protein
MLPVSATSLIHEHDGHPNIRQVCVGALDRAGPVDRSTAKKTVTAEDLVGTVPAGARHGRTNAQWQLYDRSYLR